MSNSLQPMDCTARLLCPWDFPGKNTGVGAISFSRGSSRPKDRTLISHTVGRLYHLSHRNYQTENLKQICDVQGQEMDFSAQNREYTLLLPFFGVWRGVCY